MPSVAGQPFGGAARYLNWPVACDDDAAVAATGHADTDDDNCDDSSDDDLPFNDIRHHPVPKPEPRADSEGARAAGEASGSSAADALSVGVCPVVATSMTMGKRLNDAKPNFRGARRGNSQVYAFHGLAKA